MDSVAFESFQSFQFGRRISPRLRRKRPWRAINVVIYHPQIPPHSFKSQSVTQPQRIIRDFEESIEQRIARLRELQAAEWQRIESLGPSEEDVAGLAITPPREMFEEDWRAQ